MTSNHGSFAQFKYCALFVCQSLLFCVTYYKLIAGVLTNTSKNKNLVIKTKFTVTKIEIDIDGTGNVSLCTVGMWFKFQVLSNIWEEI